MLIRLLRKFAVQLEDLFFHQDDDAPINPFGDCLDGMSVFEKMSMWGQKLAIDTQEVETSELY